MTTYYSLRYRGIYSLVEIPQSLETLRTKSIMTELAKKGVISLGYTDQASQGRHLIVDHQKETIIAYTQKLQAGYRPIGPDHQNELVVIYYRAKYRLWPMVLVLAMMEAQERLRNVRGKLKDNYHKMDDQISVTAKEDDPEWHEFIQRWVHSIIFQREGPSAAIPVRPDISKISTANHTPLFSDQPIERPVGDCLFQFAAETELRELPTSFYCLGPSKSKIIIPLNHLVRLEMAASCDRQEEEVEQFQRDQAGRASSRPKMSKAARKKARATIPITCSGHPDWVPESVE